MLIVDFIREHRDQEGCETLLCIFARLLERGVRVFCDDDCEDVQLFDTLMSNSEGEGEGVELVEFSNVDYTVYKEGKVYRISDNGTVFNIYAM